MINDPDLRSAGDTANLISIRVNCRKTSIFLVAACYLYNARTMHHSPAPSPASTEIDSNLVESGEKDRETEREGGERGKRERERLEVHA